MRGTAVCGFHPLATLLRPDIRDQVCDARFRDLSSCKTLKPYMPKGRGVLLEITMPIADDEVEAVTSVAFRRDSQVPGAHDKAV